tara:strand:- start:14111 stop:15013 length:903 start_codon:yes stop_codon:yes gene_type:complete
MNPDYLGSFQQGYSIGQMIKQNRLADEQRENQVKLGEAIKGGFKTDDKGKQYFDYDSVVPEVVKYDPQAGLNLQNQRLERDAMAQKAQALQEKEKYTRDRNQRLDDLKEKEVNAKLQANNSTNKKITSDQYKVGGFAKRAMMAEADLGKLPEEIGTSGFSDTLQGSSFFPEALKSSERKRFEQSQRNFISAVLRRESGAAISKDEYEAESLKYFPQPGDTTEDLAQKSRARQQAILNLKAEAGGAIDAIASAPQTPRKRGSSGSWEIPGISNAHAMDPQDIQNKLNETSRDDLLKFLMGN